MNLLKKTFRYLTAVSVLTFATAMLAYAEPITFKDINSYAEGQFVDVPSNSWYATWVKECYKTGLMKGSSDKTFNPSGLFTFAEASVVAAQLHSEYYSTEGPKTGATPWYQGVVDYCLKNNIYDVSDFFEEGCYIDYNLPVTRAQMAKILTNAIPNYAMPAMNNIDKIPDVTYDIQGSKEIYAMYNSGILGGGDEYGTFSPRANITRAEVATIVTKITKPAMRKTLTLTPKPKNQRVALPEVYEKMSCGLMKVGNSSDNTIGFMNGNGEMVIPIQYEIASDFTNDGYSTVRKDGLYGVIDTTGSYVVSPIHSDVYVRGKIIFAKYDGKYSLFYNGKQITGYEYTMIHNDYDLMEKGFFKVRKDSKSTYGVIDINGRVIVPTNYTYESIALVGSKFIVNTSGTHHDIYNLDGVVTGSMDVDNYNYYSGGELFDVELNGKYGIASDKGLVTEIIYESASTPYNSCYGVVYENADKHYLVDKNGIVLSSDELGPKGVWWIASDIVVVQGKDEKFYLANSDGITDKELQLHLFDSKKNNDIKYKVDDRYIIAKPLSTNTVLYVYDIEKGSYIGDRKSNMDFGGWFDYVQFRSDEGYAVISDYGVRLIDATFAKGSIWYKHDYTNVFVPLMNNSEGKYSVGNSNMWYDTIRDAIEASLTYSYETKDGIARYRPNALSVEYNGENFDFSDNIVTLISPEKTGISYEKVYSLGEGCFACYKNGTYYLECF